MNIDALRSIVYLNFDFSGVLLNVVGIIGLIIVGAFIITFLADWLIFVIDEKNGIFFKKKQKKQEDNLPERPKMLERPIIIKDVHEEPSVEEQIQDLANANKVDFEKAEQEELELKAKLAFNSEGTLEEDFDIEKEINKLKEKEYKEEIIKESEMRNSVLAENESDIVGSEDNVVDEDSETDTEDETDMFDDDFEGDFDEEFKKILEALNKDSQCDEDDDEDMQLSFIDEEPITPLEVSEEKNTLEEEVAKLKKELEEEREKLRQERISAMERTAMLEGEKERLGTELQKAKDEFNLNIGTSSLLSEDEYQKRLEILKERLKENEKQLRRSKKEFKPLERVKNTLERDKQKLRRREAIVAKQKIMLYGVNNIVDIDEEKAQKLAEDLDLLDGLRMSVQHCEEVMEANKDRYPILEQTYNILEKSNQQLKEDILEIEEALKKTSEE